MELNQKLMMTKTSTIEDHALDFVKVTERVSISLVNLIGCGDERKCDRAAVDEMRKTFLTVKVDGVVVIGEGERDKAPMLYVGEKVGSGGIQADIALDPLECTTNCAKNNLGSLSVLAVGEKGTLLSAPDIYMDKIAVGPKAKGAIDLDKPVTENILEVAKRLGKPPEDMTISILDRKRHRALIEQVKSIGSSVNLVSDGDVEQAILTCFSSSPIDMLVGIGGSPEGVLAACALKCLGGDIKSRLLWEDRNKPNKILSIDELASKDVLFIATGVTCGNLFKRSRIYALWKYKNFFVVNELKRQKN